MAQNLYPVINPNITDGVELAAYLNNFRDVYLSSFAGTSRPSSATAGTGWLDITNDPTSWTYNIYDGTADIAVFTLDLASGVATFASAGALLTLSKLSDDNVAPILKFVKERITGQQTLIGDRLGEFDFFGTDGSGNETLQARVRVISSDDTSLTEQGSYITFELVEENTASLVEVMRLRDNKMGLGNVGTPEDTLHVRGSGVRVEKISEDAVGPRVTIRKKRTTTNGQVQSGDVLADINVNSTDQNGAEILGARVRVSATELHSDTASGSKLVVSTVNSTENTLTDQVQIEDDLVTVYNDMEVLGTLTANTFVAGTVTETEDPQLLVNKGGTEAAADANNAGILVEMYDATDFLFGFDNDVASEFVAGRVGAVKEILNVDAAQQCANKSIQTPSRLDAKKDTAANLNTYAATATNGELCFASDEKAYYGIVDSALVSIGGGGGGGSFVWEMNGDGTSATREIIDGMTLMSFSNNFTQDLYAFVRVPDSYSVGKQIKLIGLVFAANVGSGNVLLKCETALIKAGTSVLGTYTNIHTSTNTEKTLSVANRFETVGDVDLSETDGEINGVAIAKGDYLRIRLYRDVASESSPAAADAKVLVYSSSVKFN